MELKGTGRCKGTIRKDQQTGRGRERERKAILGRGYFMVWRVEAHHTTFLKDGAFFRKRKGGSISSIPERAMPTIRYFLPFDPIPPPHHEPYPGAFYWLNGLLYFTLRTDIRHGIRKSTNWICWLYRHFVKVLHPRTFFFRQLRPRMGQRCLALAHLRYDYGCFFHSHAYQWRISGRRLNWSRVGSMELFFIVNAYLTNHGVVSSRERVLLLVRLDVKRGRQA